MGQEHLDNRRQEMTKAVEINTRAKQELEDTNHSLPTDERIYLDRFWKFCAKEDALMKKNGT